MDPRDDTRRAAPLDDGATILLVDDDADFRAMLADALKLEGHQVFEASTGEAALAFLDRSARTRSDAPRLLVLDLLMPRMSGIEVLQRLRRSPRWASLRVLVITGVNDPMLPVRLDVPVAFKPDPEVVLRVIRQQLAQSQNHPADR
jgi:CheY-like chemotaxis protein